MKKRISLLMVCVVVMTLWVGCSQEEETQPLIQINTDQVTVPLEEALFYVFNMQVQYENNYGSEILFQEVEPGVTLGDQLKSEALETAITVNLCAMKAREQGLDLDEAKAAEVKEEALNYFEALDIDVIQENSFTKALFEEVFYEYALMEALKADFEANLSPDDAMLESDLQVLADQDPYYALMRDIGIDAMAIKTKARHVLVYTVDETSGSPLDEAGKAEALEHIQAAKAALEAGASFESVVDEYSDDSLSQEAGGQYTISRGQKGPEFDAALESLEVGEISDIIEVSYGYHIIEVLEKDIPPTEEELAELEAYEQKAYDYAVSAQGESRFEDQYQSWTEENDIKINQTMWSEVTVKGQSSHQ